MYEYDETIFKKFSTILWCTSTLIVNHKMCYAHKEIKDLYSDFLYVILIYF